MMDTLYFLQVDTVENCEKAIAKLQDRIAELKKPEVGELYEAKDVPPGSTVAGCLTGTYYLVTADHELLSFVTYRVYKPSGDKYRLISLPESNKE